MPAQSPTLSPTLSAMTAGLRGSSSGIPASTLPTRSAPTSAALVKMPPPRRAKIETSEAPNASAIERVDDDRGHWAHSPDTTRYIEEAEIASSARPATSMPVTAPARNAMVRPCCSPVRAASAVRTLARTEMFMPMKPAAPDRIAPSTKPAALKPAEEGEDDRGDDHADDGDGGVLAAEVGRGAFLDRAGHFDHALVAGRGAEHLLAGENAVKQRDDAAGNRDKDQIHVVKFPY